MGRMLCRRSIPCKVRIHFEELLQEVVDVDSSITAIIDLCAITEANPDRLEDLVEDERLPTCMDTYMIKSEEIEVFTPCIGVGLCFDILVDETVRFCVPYQLKDPRWNATSVLTAYERIDETARARPTTDRHTDKKVRDICRNSH